MAPLPELAHDREAVLAGQHDVEDHQIEMLRWIEQTRQRPLAIVLHFGRESLRLQVEAQPFGQVLFVFDDEDALGHVDDQADAGADGSCSVKVLP